MTTYGDLLFAHREMGWRQGFTEGVAEVTRLLRDEAAALFLKGDDAEAGQLRTLANLAGTASNPHEMPHCALLDGAWKHLRPVEGDDWDAEVDLGEGSEVES